MKILELAKRASPGPWKFDAGNHDVELPKEGRRTILRSDDEEKCCSPKDDDNLDYVSRLDPQTVEAMIKEIIAWRVNSRPG